MDSANRPIRGTSFRVMDRPKKIAPPADRSVLPRIVSLGQQRGLMDDFYHSLLTRPWWQFLAFLAGVYLTGASVFAVAYHALPGALANARPGSWEDAFFFSTQSLSGSWYGPYYPTTPLTHALVTTEAFTGLLSLAIITGLTFARFARPTARVLFTRSIAMGPRNGVPHLLFRMANWRHNQIVEAQLRVVVLMEERTQEGDVLRVPVELALVRDRTALFTLTWTAMHPITPGSPFHGPEAMERLRAQGATIYLSFTGTDETFGQGVHARQAYALDDIVPDTRFADVLTVRPDGTRVIDYRHFHELVPLSAPSQTVPTATP